jgi:dipeptidyl aminopeptidase/acylaminoacyl peptidase
MLFGFHQSDYYSKAYSFNQFLASRGYIVIAVNFRGGTGYGRRFRMAERIGSDPPTPYGSTR